MLPSKEMIRKGLHHMQSGKGNVENPLVGYARAVDYELIDRGEKTNELQ